MIRRQRPHGATLTLLGIGGYAVALTGLAGLLVAQVVRPTPAVQPAGRPVSLAPVLAPDPSGGGGGHDPATGLEAPPAALGRTAPDQTVSFRPQRLVLPDGVGAAVLAESVRADGSLVIPTDPQQVGWWTGGALAGDPFGSVVIAGHVDSARYGLGVLAGLRNVTVGQVLQVRAGSRILRYRVVGRSQVRQARLAQDTDIFRQDVAPRLVVVTCGGPFNTMTHRYQDNLIVVATPLD